MKSKGIFRHALSMVIKNKRAYLMLSITIIMSFTFFLSYLIYTDSKIMTKNADIIKQDSGFVRSITTFADDTTKYTYMQNLDKMDKTKYFIIEEIEADNTIREEFCGVDVIPNNAWSMYLHYNYELVREDNSTIKLNKNQALVNVDVFNELKGKNKDGKIYMEIPIVLNNGNVKYINVEIIGGYKSKNKTEDVNTGNSVIISKETVQDLDYNVVNEYMFIYTKYPKRVHEMADNLNVMTSSIYQDKQKEFPNIKKELRSKSIIAIVLFVLLGINLYSSFTNALNERKFEIGVKRAIGASGLDIILQFLYEGIIVVFTNVLISSMLAVFIFIGYKWYVTMIKNSYFIFYISKFSIATYLIATMFLTVAFSVMFAVQSARVEIIRYIKGE